MKSTLFKSSTALITAFALSIAAISAPRKAHALIGIATGSTGLAVTGGIIAALGSAVLIPVFFKPEASATSESTTDSTNEVSHENVSTAVPFPGADPFGAIIGTLLGVFIVAALLIIAVPVGVIMLDQNNPDAAPQFMPLSNEAIAKAGLTSEEVKSYSAEISELNAYSESITEAAAKLSTQEEKLELATQEWKSAFAGFSPKTLGAIQKLVNTGLASAAK